MPDVLIIIIFYIPPFETTFSVLSLRTTFVLEPHYLCYEGVELN